MIVESTTISKALLEQLCIKTITCVRIHVCVCVHAHTCICICVCACTHMHVHMYACMHAKGCDFEYEFMCTLRQGNLQRRTKLKLKADLFCEACRESLLQVMCYKDMNGRPHIWKYRISYIAKNKNNDNMCMPAVLETQSNVKGFSISV